MGSTLFSHLAIGTEITLGQILNSNSQWFSRQLEPIGLSCLAHLAVADNRQHILKAMQYLSAESDLIFVTGGLGPTSDDFTRELVSEFTGSPLEWSTVAWEHLTTYLNKRQLKIRDSHKQECFIPKGAHVFINPIGTACGFSLKVNNKLWIVLPGPPREIASIWEHGLERFLHSTYPTLDPMDVHKWDVFGLPESAVAEILEPELEECPFEAAYRIHLPYIEFKLRYPRSQAPVAKMWIQKVQSLLEPYVFTQNGQDIWSLCLEHIQHQYPNHNLVISDKTKSEVLKKRFSDLLNHPLHFYTQLGRGQRVESAPPTIWMEFNFGQNTLDLLFEAPGSASPPIQFQLISTLSPASSTERIHKDLLERALISLYQKLSTHPKL